MLQKLRTDSAELRRPSAPAHVAVMLSETRVTDAVIDALVRLLLNGGRSFRAVCFIGAPFRARMKLRRALSGHGFEVLFTNDPEKAKQRLLP